MDLKTKGDIYHHSDENKTQRGNYEYRVLYKRVIVLDKSINVIEVEV